MCNFVVNSAVEVFVDYGGVCVSFGFICLLCMVLGFVLMYVV